MRKTELEKTLDRQMHNYRLWIEKQDRKIRKRLLKKTYCKCGCKKEVSKGKIWRQGHHTKELI